MKKTNVAKNLSVRDARDFAAFYDDISSDWELRAERLQHRRWRKFKNDDI